MAFPTGISVLPGYVTSIGNKMLMVFDRTGPASYVQFVTPSTGGDSLSNTTGGINLGGFDDVIGNIDTTGQIIAYAVGLNQGTGNSTRGVRIVYYSLVTATLGGQSQTAGTQIAASTNLSTFSWRFLAVAV